MRFQFEKRNIIRRVLSKKMAYYYLNEFIKYFNQLEKMENISYNLRGGVYILSEKIDCGNGKYSKTMYFQKADYWLYKMCFIYEITPDMTTQYLSVPLASIE